VARKKKSLSRAPATQAFLLVLGIYNCFGFGSLDRTTIAPRHVIPAPSRYTAVEPPSGTVAKGFRFANAAGVRHKTATTASHHLRFIRAPFATIRNSSAGEPS
jgi:hypothetical protein